MDNGVSVREGVAHLPAETVRWPFDQVHDALTEVRDEARVVVITLAVEAPDQRWSDDELLQLERFPLPVVAALSGDVAEHAMDLALAADIRVAEVGAQLRMRRLGGRRLLTLLGMDRSVELLERGGVLSAEEALEWGLVSRAAPAGALSEGVQKLAETVASRGPLGTQLAKEAIWRGLAMPLEQALRFETDLTLLLQSTNDRAEGVRAFLEKRTPQFTGK